MPDRAAERLIADRYALETSIGRGGMGIVWRARDTLLGREVAIKEVRVPATVPDSERDSMRARVLREARAAARLNHPGAVTLYDVINEQGHAFIVMELIHAPTLAEVVASEGPLDPARAAGVGLQVAAALAAAHQAGIVHRDVKPGNVMLAPDGTARLTDFGIARVQGDPKLTSTGLIVGSPAYMAPEQASGQAAGPASDLWALGATLYFAVEGSSPFERGGSIATLTAVVNEEPRPPRRAGPLAPIISALLSKSPDARPSAQELRSRLERVMSGESEPAGARPPGASGPRSPRPGPSGPGRGGPGHQRPDQPARPVTVATVTMPGQPPLDLAGERPEQAAVPTERQEAPRRRLPAAGAPLLPPRGGPRALRGRVGVAVALLVVVALLGTALGLSGAFSGGDRRGGATPRTAPSRGAAGTTAPSRAAPGTTAPPSTGQGQALPAGWVSRRSEAGAYGVAYPRDWRVSTSSANNNTDLRGPGGLLIRVQSSDSPSDPMRAWTELERTFARRHAGQGYQRIALRPGSYNGFDAAVWEFSYLLGGERVRARDVTFKSADGRWGYAILLQAPERQWAQAQAVGADFERAFTPLG
jgi:tRNA A-37 threonylcarbamoyl transferase component Bud32